MVLDSELRRKVGPRTWRGVHTAIPDAAFAIVGVAREGNLPSTREPVPDLFWLHGALELMRVVSLNVCIP